MKYKIQELGCTRDKGGCDTIYEQAALLTLFEFVEQ